MAAAFGLVAGAPGTAFADTPAAVPAQGPAPSPLPPLESREIATRPSPKSPQDLLLPGETLHRRWADPTQPDAPGKPPSAARPAPSRSAAVLPPPVRVTPMPAAPAAPVVAAPIRPARPAPAAAVPPRKKGQGPAPVLRLGPANCGGQYFLDGVAVDAMGRPCAGF
ncbi:hypothetical protein D3874_07410 [Oleomonas cavernae]|uniref:Uncharacterized protein n=1 Tax=Oleomonas cavernae TaxID=2320859 RepID=A0A418WA28_9PROT|nr:hypothetical protein D3874_07410 [Oleomonas cavernae]